MSRTTLAKADAQGLGAGRTSLKPAPVAPAGDGETPVLRRFCSTCHTVRACNCRLVSCAAVAAYPDAHNTVYDFCAQVWSRGGRLTEPDGLPRLDSREARDGLDFQRWLVRDSGVAHPAALETDSVGSGAIFARGEAAMMTNWFGFAAHAATAPESAVRGKVDVAPMPHAPGAGSVAVLVYWVLAIGSGSRNPDLARAFVRHATSAPMDRLLTLEGGIGCHTATWADPEVVERIPFATKMGELHDLARTLPADRRLPALAAIIDAAVGEALRTHEASETILDRAQDKAASLWAAAT